MISSRADHIGKRRKIKELYTDFNINMDIDHNTGDLIRLINADSVKESIKNLILTDTGERFYHLNVGSVIRRSMFGLIDEMTAKQVEDTCRLTITNYEPRAQNVEVKVKPMPQDNAYEVFISFTLINIPNQVFHISDIINRIR